MVDLSCLQANASPEPPRLLLVARPAVGRPLAARLRHASYTVFRSPGESSLPKVIERVRPRLLLLVVPVPWLEIEAVHQARRISRWPVPLLVLCDIEGDGRLVIVERTDDGIDPDPLLQAVTLLLTDGEPLLSLQC
jgi:hypothetical protein